MQENKVVKVKCPHCQEVTSHIYEDGWDNHHEDDTFLFHCPKCSKLHRAFITANISYKTSVFRKLLCKNGDAPHNYDDEGICRECFEMSEEGREMRTRENQAFRATLSASCATIVFTSQSAETIIKGFNVVGTRFGEEK